MKISLDIKALRAKWKPQTKIIVSYGQHGSSAGDRNEEVYYLNPYSGNWTSEEAAFRGFVHQYLDNKLFEIELSQAQSKINVLT